MSLALPLVVFTLVGPSTPCLPPLSTYASPPYTQQCVCVCVCVFVCMHAPLCPALCHPMDCSPPGSSVHRIAQARILLSFPPPRDLPDPGIEPTSLASPSLAGRFVTTVPHAKPSHIAKFRRHSVFVRLFATPWAAWPTRLLCPWDFPGKGTRVGGHFLLQGNLPDPGIEPRFPSLQADALLTN